MGTTTPDPAQIKWLEDVFGIKFNGRGSGGDTSAGTGTPLLPVWMDAKDNVDAAIAKLQYRMQGFPHPLLARVAEQGLNGLTDGRRVGLQAALMDYDRAAPADRPKLAEKVGVAVKSFKAFLDADKTVPLLEKNPFGVPLTIRATLGAALETIASSIKA